MADHRSLGEGGQDCLWTVSSRIGGVVSCVRMDALAANASCHVCFSTPDQHTRSAALLGCLWTVSSRIGGVVSCVRMDARAANASFSDCVFDEPAACGDSIAFQQSFRLTVDSTRRCRNGGVGRAALQDPFVHFAVARGPTAAGHDPAAARQRPVNRAIQPGRANNPPQF
jgi:hypothetical protein